MLAFNKLTCTSHSVPEADTSESQSQQQQEQSETETAEPPTKLPQSAQASLQWECIDELIVQASSASDLQEERRGIDAELNQFLTEPVIPRTEDPLGWWRQNMERFPNMAAVARTYLGAPPTSVPSERLFSVAGEVINDHRSSLLPENAARLIFLKYNCKLIKE